MTNAELVNRYRAFCGALQNAAQRVGLRSLSERFDKSYSGMANAANPFLPDAQFNALQLAYIIEKSGSVDLVTELAALTGHVVLPGASLTAHFSDEPTVMAMQVLCKHMSTASVTGGLLSETFADYRVEKSEAALVAAAIDTQIQALQGIKAVVMGAAK